MSYEPKAGERIDGISPLSSAFGPGLWLELAGNIDGDGSDGRKSGWWVTGRGSPGSAVAISALLPVFHAVYAATMLALATALETQEISASIRRDSIHLEEKREEK